MRSPQELLFYQDLYSESPCQKQRSRTSYFNFFLLKIFRVLAGIFGEVFYLFVWRVLLCLFVCFWLVGGFVVFVWFCLLVLGFLFVLGVFCCFVGFFFSSLVVLIIIDGEVEYCSDILCMDHQTEVCPHGVIPTKGDPQHKYTTNCFITCCSIFRYLHGKETNCFRQTAVQEAYG